MILSTSFKTSIVMEDLTEEDRVVLASSFAEIFMKLPVPEHDSILTGKLYFQELMATNNEPRFLASLRMNKTAFVALLHLLKTEGNLRDGTKVCAGEKVMIFIHVLVGQTNRQCKERWQHSGDTIHACLYECISAIIRCRESFLVTPDDSVPDHILNNPKFFPFFKDCIGALDGSHVPAIVSPEFHPVFRNRKKSISQNVLGVCDFELKFTYALCGWEGSAHDGKVLHDALTRENGLLLLPGKYYLGDAGYALSKFCLTPYRGVRYHLKEWAKSKQRPQNKEELFNLRHASLRNVVERIFGVTKKQFPILTCMTSFPFSVQCELVICAFMLHNWIRCANANAWGDDSSCVDEEDDDGEGEVPDISLGVDASTAKELIMWRDGIAASMWQSYQEYLSQKKLSR